jgi:hypothetical protein
MTDDLIRAARAVVEAIQQGPEDAADVVIERLSEKGFSEVQDHSEERLCGVCGPTIWT